jgi:hypothetical protein
VLAAYVLEQHELLLLRQAVGAADICEQLQRTVSQEGPLLGGKAHPAAVELRLQRITLTRILVALRVPLGDEAADSKHGPPRLQRRGTRGVYRLRGAS